ncbi:MAG: hypothetical protein HWN67_04520 [Candidatus Helarchaeota archaeon]|nr:hypothetical protein [Candidatus Helarchaeota archaeon]
MTIIGFGLAIIALYLLLISTGLGVTFGWGFALGAIGSWIMIFTNIKWNLIQSRRIPDYSPIQKIRERRRRRPFKLTQDTEKVLKLSKCPVCKAPLKKTPPCEC